MTLPDRPELLSVQGVTKAYPGVVANSDVSFSVSEGEVHALLGENGAGKSTLVKMIYGLVKPDAGRMRFKGQDYTPARPAAARQAGVAMVFQHFSLFEAPVELTIIASCQHREYSSFFSITSNCFCNFVLSVQ